MNGNSSHSGSAAKPSKPDKDLPLIPRATNRWAKKIRGKLHYCGPWKDPQGALQRYLDVRDDLHAGRKPRLNGDGLTVRDLCNRFLTSKQNQVNIGEINHRSSTD